MRNIMLVLQFTLREAFSKKLIITLFILSTLAIVIIALLFQLGDAMQIRINQQVEETDVVRGGIKMLEMGFINTAFGLGLFLSIFAVAGLIPDLLQKGNIDLFLSKLITREQLIFGKFLGSVLIIMLNIVYFILALWVLVGLKFEFWGTGILFSIVSITFAFAVLYSIMIFLGILTKSSVLPIIVSYLIYIVLSPLISNRDKFEQLGSEVLDNILEILHYIIPNTAEILAATNKVILGTGDISWEPFIISFYIMVFFFVVSLIMFRRMDF